MFLMLLLGLTCSLSEEHTTKTVFNIYLNPFICDGNFGFAAQKNY